MVRTNLSAYAFKFGDRGGSFADFTPASASVFSNSALPCGLAAALRRWLDPVPFQNVSDRGAGKIVPQIGQHSRSLLPVGPPEPRSLRQCEVAPVRAWHCRHIFAQ